MSVTITREIAQKVRDTVDAGLSSGLGQPVPGQMCVEAAVCYALELSHSDDPQCVAQSLRRLKIRLNDASWSSNEARAKGLRRLALAQLGSAGVLDEPEFVRRVVEMTIRKALPVGLRAAAASCSARGFADHAAKLESAAVRCEQDGTREDAWHAREIASDASDAYASASDAYASASDAYASAADASAYAASSASAAAYASADASAASASASAADAADASAYAASSADAAARTRDRVLAQYAEWVVEILIDLRAPGCQWLDLVPLEG